MAEAPKGQIGLGTYRGGEDDADDDRMCEVLRYAFERGIRIVDTAVTYRAGRSEVVVGRAVVEAIRRGVVRRDDLEVWSKGGFVRPSASALRTPPAPEAHEPRDHCLRPACLRYHLELSLMTLGLETIDVWYLHNPEEAASRARRDEFHALMRTAFQTVEQAVSEGLIRSYGIATWTGGSPHSAWSIRELKALARDVAETSFGRLDRLTHVQAPLSLTNREALIPARDGSGTSCVGMCQSLGLHFAASASAGSGRIPALAVTSVGWVRHLPGVGTALVGTLAKAHLEPLLDDGQGR